MLFWCFIHNGAWPHWLDNFHFKFMFDMHVDYLGIVEYLQPSVYKIIEKILNCEEELKPLVIEGLNEWAIQHGFQVIIIYFLLYNFGSILIFLFCNIIFTGVIFNFIIYWK